MKQLATIALLIFSANAYAIFCPTNFSNIDFGDTIEQVVELCGKPNSTHSYKSVSASSQEWVYYIKTQMLDQSTSKMSLVFKDDKVINITISDNSTGSQLCDSAIQASNSTQLIRAVCNNPFKSGQHSVESTDACGRKIRLGDNSQTIMNACGNPVATTQYQQAGAQDTPEITAFQYDGPPPVILVFENGRLKERNT